MAQVVTTKSWGSRILNALCGVFFGFALVIGAFILIFWNESHGLHTAQSLQQTQQILKMVPSSPLNPNNNLQVVYFSGLATTTDILKDALFGLSEKAIALKRNVSMYQWEEHSETHTSKNLGGSETETKTYTYKQVWSDQVIDSNRFQEQNGHQNPASMPLNSRIVYAKNVTVGDFTLPQDLIEAMQGDSSIDLANMDTAALQSKLHKNVVHDGANLYVGDDQQTPKTGDLKISYSEILPQTVSVIAQQFQHTLQPYVAPAGASVSLIVMGEKSPQLMIDDAESANAMMMWILRGVSLFMMMLGLALIMAPISVLADFVPFFGSLVGFGTGLIAFVGGIVLWSGGVAIAWFAVRPLMSIGILALATVICFTIISYKKQHAAK